jgi:DNA-binding XRE family transcriptional regulator
MPDGITSDRKHDLCKKLASNLATLRTKANVKQDELADRLGFSRQTISAIETGKRDMQWSTFTAIAPFFSRNQEIKELMVVMGILDSCVDELLSVGEEGLNNSLQARKDENDFK